MANVKPEYQAYILTNYKLIELYNIFANNEGYNQYIRDLFAVSNEYCNRAIALLALHTEASLHSLREKKAEKLDPAATMCQMYDRMSEEDREQFCQDMLGKKEFFMNSYKMMMDTFENAAKVERSEEPLEKTEK